MIGVSAEAVLVERGADARRRGRPSCRSARRRRRRRAAWRHRGAGEQLERRVVVDRAVGAQQAAVAVARVLAEAHVGDDEQVGVRGLDRARGELDDALVVPGARALARPCAAGMPNSRTAGDAERVRPRRPPRRRRRSRGGRRRASRRSARGRRGPASTNSGQTRSPGSQRASRARGRAGPAVARRRRRRVCGKATPDIIAPQGRRALLRRRPWRGQSSTRERVDVVVLPDAR